MQKIVNKKVLTKAKSISKGTLKDIQKTNSAKTSLPQVSKNTPRISKNIETSKTRSTKVLTKTNSKSNPKISSETKKIKIKKEDNDEDEFVMIEKSVTITHTSTTFFDEEDEAELGLGEDWFGGARLKKQKELEGDLEDEDMSGILESFKDDDKNW